MLEQKSLCMDCKYAKDKWHGSCFCSYYGIIFYRGKKNCWGHEIMEENEDATDYDHREPDKRA